MIRFHAFIPAENPAKRGQSLNVLLVTENTDGRDFVRTVRIFGRLEGEWRELLAEERDFPAHSHPHLYFNIPAKFLSEAFWGEEVDEIALTAGEEAPGEKDWGTLVFIV